MKVKSQLYIASWSFSDSLFPTSHFEARHWELFNYLPSLRHAFTPTYIMRQVKSRLNSSSLFIPPHSPYPLKIISIHSINPISSHISLYLSTLSILPSPLLDYEQVKSRLYWELYNSLHILLTCYSPTFTICPKSPPYSPPSPPPSAPRLCSKWNPDCTGNSTIHSTFSLPAIPPHSPYALNLHLTLPHPPHLT